MRKLLVVSWFGIFALLGLAVSATGQPEGDWLPIGLTEEEKLRLDEIGITHHRSDPPDGAIRSVAEWERNQGVIIRWPLGISYALVAEMSEDVMVTTIVASTSEQNSAISYYTANGVNMANTNFLVASTNSIWTRDYGPWFVFEEGGDMAIVDHIYNRPRPLDDQIPWTLGTNWGLTVYGMDLIATGGNHMCDGVGISMSTSLIYDENPSLTEAEVDSIMLAFMGNDFVVMDDVESGGIHHIDCWAKLLSPGTILVEQVPASDASYAAHEARAQYLSQLMSPWGRPYEVVRIYCPSGTAYTNSLILNDKVLVPTFGSAWDATALQVYEDAMPGYEVIGFSGSFLDDDAIHCRTMGVPDSNMLYLEHVPLTNQTDTLSDYEIVVLVEDHSDAGLVADSMKIFYNVNSGPFAAVMMTQTTRDGYWHGYIPAQTSGEIAYYIQAADYSGRVETHPFIGAPWAHRFQIDLPPSLDIDITEIADSVQAGEQVSEYVRVKNDGPGILSISFASDDSWLDFSTEEFSIYPDDSIDLEVTLNGAGLAFGDHSGSVDFTCNDPETASGSIPFSLHIFTPDVYVAQAEIAEELTAGQSTLAPLSIQNLGPGNLDVTVACRMFPGRATASAPATEPLGYHSVSDKGDPAEPFFPPVTLGYGGPDTYGHFWNDSDEPGGPVFDWVDISGVGTSLTMGDDDSQGPFALGFPFPFYDSVYTELYVGSNGLVSFDEPDNSRNNVSLPNGAHNAIIAMWWDDLDARKGGSIRYYADAVGERFIVSFEQVRFYSGSTGTGSLSFQVILTPDGLIRLQYGDMNPGTLTLQSAAIGIQNAAADDGLTVVNSAAYMHSDLTVEIRGERWLTASPAGGQIGPYGDLQIDVGLDASELEAGSYAGQITVSSNDPDTPAWVVPVSLTVASAFVCGDIDNNGAGPDISDLIYLVNYMFKQGPVPPVPGAADVDSSGGLDIADVVYLVNYMFKQGPELDCP